MRTRCRKTCPLAPAHKVDENKITSIIKPKKTPGIEGHIYRRGTERLLSWRNAECRRSQARSFRCTENPGGSL